MEYFIEGVLELLFGLVKSKPDKMSEIEYIDKFVIKNDPKKIAMRIFASVLFAIVFAILSIFVDNDTRILFLIFIVLGVIILFLSINALSFKCMVTEETLSKKEFFIFKKTINWKDIICVRKCETEDDKNVIIALYNTDKKCVLDVSSEMQNAWFLIKMAEQKNIEIRNEKNLSLKQISKL